MTKWQFQQIIQRDQAALLRSTDAVGSDWLSPILQLEAEADRHELILFCGKLSDLLRKHREQDHH